ncbi:hypothetical protein TNCT_72291 [Trichonephila clavata]|uniref:Uncharacterized protein n=1 Tax=Trichonephila clavata TaxID=2740835 RepID=A0A8X6F1D4_TRICU|nr:hypothetical protein TNCT_72291 [Trichonephila clavata]
MKRISGASTTRKGLQRQIQNLHQRCSGILPLCMLPVPTMIFKLYQYEKYKLGTKANWKCSPILIHASRKNWYSKEVGILCLPPIGEIRNRFSTSVQEIFDLDLKSAPSIQLVYYHRVSDFE